MDKNIWVIAPHPDDELIGCFQLLESGCITGVIYVDLTDEPRRMREAESCCRHYGIEKSVLDWEERPHSLMRSLTIALLSLPQDAFYLVPWPFEPHPMHQHVATVVSTAYRNVGYYSTVMQGMPLGQVKHPERKKELLDLIYPSQRSLWKYDHRYFLFESVLLRGLE